MTAVRYWGNLLRAVEPQTRVSLVTEHVCHRQTTPGHAAPTVETQTVDHEKGAGMKTARTRIGVALSVSVAVAASLAGTAGARLPDGGMDGASQARPQVSFGEFNLGLYLPANTGLSSIDGWISQRMTRVSAQEATFAGPAAVARAIAWRNR